MSQLFKKTGIPVIIAAFAFASCNSGVKETEKVEINTMDSTSKAIKENKEKLDEQTRKVEASLEKLDNEFDSTENN